MKFILHGGATRNKELIESNRTFFFEMAKDFNEPKILLVYFAKEPETYSTLYEQDAENFKQVYPKKIFSFTTATVENFGSQAKDSDIIYVRGGDTRRLIEKFKKINNLKEAINGKIYGGSSAGANAIVKYYFSFKLDKVEQGLGIIPIKTFPHWEESKQEKLALLQNTGGNLPVYKLKEGEFVVLNFDL
jgi:peptidase E